MDQANRQTDRRAFLRGAALASGGAMLTGQLGYGAKPAERPNILWITAEDMSPNLGCYGDDYADTPNIDRLAKESVRYTHVFATAPVCSPVRSCLITGCYATTLGTMNLRSAFPIPKQITGFPSYLRKAGYFCTNNVKTDYNTSNSGAIIKASWNDCSAKAHWRGRGKPDQPFFAIFNDMVTHQSRSMVMPYEQFRKEVQSKLEPKRRHDPARAPVPPYYPDTPIIRRTIARNYDCISVMDENTGQILKQLEEDGLAEDTIVFFYSDHGAGLPRHKRMLHDSGMRVPLLIRFPKKYRHLSPADPGQTLDRLISFVDFPPTVLSLTGQAIPDYMQGEPFLGPAKTEPRQYVFGARDRVDEAFDLARSVRDKNWLYVRNYMPHLSYNQPSGYPDQGEIRNEITALAKAGKLTSEAQKHYAGPTKPLEELYDTANDPHQVNNLMGGKRLSWESQRHFSRLSEALRRWIIETRDLGFLPECDMAERSGEGTPYDMARRKGDYPIETVVRFAGMVKAGTGVIDRQIAPFHNYGRNYDSAARYWAAVGLRAALQDYKRPLMLERFVIESLLKALDDSSPAVRVEAAWALVDAGKSDKALPLLEQELESSDKRAALRAARALQMLGEKARPALPVMKRALKKATAEKGDPAMFIRFALDPAVQALEKSARSIP